MSNGYWGKILRVDLTNRKVESQSLDDKFYRTYLGGSALGSYFICQETKAETAPLDPENVLVIAPGVTTGAAISGLSRCCITALSPLTNMIGDSQLGGSIGPMIKRAGYDAIVISGRASQPVYLYVSAEKIEIREANNLWGKSTIEVQDLLEEELGNKQLSILQCGPAGEKLVRFACILGDRNDVAGRTGLGAVLGSKKLRAVAVKGSQDIPFANPAGLKQLAQSAAKKIPQAGFVSGLKESGTLSLVEPNAESGNLSTHNYSQGQVANYQDLCAQAFEEMDAGATTCFGCAVRCRRKVKAQKPYQVSDQLGAPEFETIGLLGANLDITDAAAVARANQLCGEYGLDTITMGCIAGYLVECQQNDLINQSLTEGKKLSFGQAEDLFWLIEKVGKREGIGDVLADGFEAAIAKFGPDTAAYAIHVKNQGLAAHMPQVKPAMALIYAVCPIGPDHMSCEHDWLIEAGGDALYGLGVTEKGDRQSMDLAKAQLVASSQAYFSLLDSLCLCMFCWSPDNLFSYQDIEQLIADTTGWQMTFLELIRVGERRINLMRQINARRGFSKKEDKLPERLFDPLPDGPSKGRHVDPENFEKMQGMYYELMGWDPTNGNPTRAKLLQLGLDWAI
jgi:aldehyde:ferredoxin oxidoreductase